MSGLTLTLTHAGRAKLINAEHTGTAPVTITQVGVTASAFDPAPTVTSVPGEIKRLGTMSGQNVAADTVHITIRDDSTASYTLRGFGLYLADGTLFAVYSQSGTITQKSAQSMLLLSVDIKLLQVAASSITFGNANFLNPPATTTVQGVIELATANEAKAGTDSARAITPATLKTVLEARLPDDMAGKLDKIKDAPEDISERIDSGLYQRQGTGPGWPVQGSHWWHLLSLTHSNTANYFALQFACRFSNAELSFRTTNNDGDASWHTFWHSGNFDPDSRLKLTGGVMTGNVTITRTLESSLDLYSTHENGRRIRILSNATPNAGFYDVTGNQWLFRIGSDDLGRIKGFSGHVSVYAPANINAHYWLCDETGRKRGLVYWNRVNDALYLQRYDPDTGDVKGKLRINADGTVTSDYAITAPGFTGKASSADKLNSSTTINGTSFNGMADIITSRWGAERTLKIGNASKAVNGTGNVTWTLADIGAAPIAHTHVVDDVSGVQTALDGKLSKTGGTLTGNLVIAFGNESSLDLVPTHANGRKIRILSNSTPNTGFYDVTNGAWLFRIDDNNTAHFAGEVKADAFNGNASSANKLKTARTLSIGNAAKSFDGTSNLTWSLADLGYSSAKTANGWMKRPDGIIEQWGLYLLFTNSEITRSVTFPIAFPNACLNVTVTDLNPPVSNKDKYDLTAQVNQGSLTATGFSVFIQAPGGVGNNWAGMYWRAIGH